MKPLEAQIENCLLLGNGSPFGRRVRPYTLHTGNPGVFDTNPYF